ncbi:hypothetical protein LMG28688_05242 [Paraburkholderia caffeinitolerans]|uniref:ABM domain-containing protein n=1 Tax=Paraburkholderia caffeinitolerans TaxID=1723730 RepID=A0A6J5GJR3_9BURK|nr:antibiotic biosynthesis monooxygenase [Paraburkholderia caffeinitolerans]CAB3800779.1 hypothetical protein LMG28688_05242 [Paraburkholderia caffeinitolerans]
MFFHIDFIKTEEPEVLTSQWRTFAQTLDKAPFFSGAWLHSTYRCLNQDEYQLVGITEWEGDGAHADPRAARPCPLCSARGDARGERNLYTVLNQGGDVRKMSFTGNVVVTNPYRIERGEAAKYAQMWDESKRHMEMQPGFVNAFLFQCVNPESDYFLISRAEWKSEEMFMKQFEGKDFRRIVEPFEGIFSICLSTVVSEISGESGGEQIRAGRRER